jgi:prepilin-type N-terminal cleavage/methylation domain-containing protein/prepilin-type processing-associated H-X9-DG protein
MMKVSLDKLGTLREGRGSKGEGGAFTLLELLVVIAIIAVLAGVVSYGVSHAVESARASNCTGNLRQLGIALSGYLGDHDNLMPTLQMGRISRDEDTPVIDNTLVRYIAGQSADSSQPPAAPKALDPSKSVFACPADRKFAMATGTSYGWNTALNGQSAAALNFFNKDDHTQIPVIFDKEGFHPYEKDKVNVLYADGHATRGFTFTVKP